MGDLEDKIKALEQENLKLKKENDIFKSRTIATDQIFNRLNVGMVVLDLDGRIIDYNGVITKIYGVENFNEYNYLNFIVDNQKSQVQEDLAKVLKYGSYGPIEYELLNDNSKFLANVTISVLKENYENVGFLALIEDLTKTRAVENKLDEFERNYKDLIENINEVVYSVDVQGNLTFVSPAIINSMIYSPDELVGKNFFEFVHPDDSQKVAKNFESSLKGEFRSLRFRAFDKDGSLKHLETSSRLNYSSDDVVGITGIFMDITDRVNFENRLKQSEEKYRLLFQNMSSGFSYHEVIFDNKNKPIDYIFRDVNPAFERLTGLKRDKILNKRVLEVLPNTEKEFIEKFGMVALTGKSISFESYSQELERYFNIVAYSPKIGTFASVFTDVTQRKKIHEKLVESEHKFRAISEQSLVGISISKKGQNVYANQALSFIFEKSVDEILSWKQAEICKNLGMESDSMLENYTSKEEKTRLTEFQIDTGSKKKWVDSYAKVINYENDLAVLRILVDVTSKKDLENKLRTTIDEKEILLKEVNHRVKNNLQVISSLLTLQGETSSDDLVKEKLYDARGRVLAFSSIHAHLYKEDNFSQIRMDDYITNFSSSLISDLTMHDIACEYHLDKIYFNLEKATPFGLILNETLTNSIKYLETDKQKRIDVLLEEKEDKYFFMLKDNGKGFPKSVLEGNQDSLGLTLINSLSMQLNASVKFYNNLGAVVEMYIPKGE